MARILPKTISHDEFLKIIKAEKRKDFKLAFILGFYQAMRISEIKALRPEDVDQERGFIHLIQAKGNKDRDVPLMLPVRQALRWGKKFLPFKFSIRTLQRAIKRAGIDVLDKDIHFHTLRHSGSTFYLNEGINGKKADIRQIQGLLGHSRIDTTMIYTHVTPDSLKKVFDSIFE